MTPLKETLEAVESGASQESKPLKTDAVHLREDAVSLDVPVKIHGSRVTEIVMGVTPHTEPFEEQASTMIVFPQGGVLRMSTVVSVGQAVVLTNLKSRKDAICRVAKVRACPNNQNYVEVEFTHRQPGYWGVHFSSDGPELAKKSVPVEAGLTPAPRISVIRPAESNVVPSHVRPAGTPAESAVQQGMPESSFIAIGSQEKVQPAASSTSGTKGGDPFAIGNTDLHSDRSSSAGTKKSTVANFPSAPAASPFRSVAELRRDAQAASISVPSHGASVSEPLSEDLDALLPDAVEQETGQSRPAFGNFASSVVGGAPRSLPREMFGAHLEAEESGAGEQATGPRKNWILIAACAFAALVVAAAVVYYFRGANSPASGAASVSAPAAQDAPDASANSISQQGQPAQQANMVNSNRASSVPPTREVVVVHADAPSAKTSKASVETLNVPSVPATPAVVSVPSEPSAPAKPQGSRPVSNLFGSLNAHPAANRSSSNQSIEAAPSLDLGVASGPDGNALGGSSPIVSALAKPAPDGPIDVGGNVVSPRLISSVPPVYPSIAIQTRVEGTVLIETIVDKTGNVSSAKVISGPQLLRESALDALRRWKYQPSVLNGQPISVRMTVSIQFRR